MIRVLCLNPAIDKMYHINGFIAGKQYHQITPQMYPGGKGINVARVIHYLGGNPMLYCFLAGYNGEFISKAMAELSIPVVIFKTSGETRTTINIIDKEKRIETEITEPGPKINEEDEKILLAQLKKDIQPSDIVICSGLPANGMSIDIYKKISHICKANGACCALDANNQFLSNAFPGSYFFVKPNQKELQTLFNKEDQEISDGDIIAMAANLLDEGIGNILVSRGRKGSIFINKEKKYLISVPDEPVVSTIGCGDSTVAGFCYGYSKGYSIEQCIAMAMAAGVSNAKIGKVGVIDPKDIPALSAKMEIRKL